MLAVPGVDDVLRVEALERARGLAVVAELAVVVVLDHDGLPLARPAHERRPPLGGEGRAERELVRGGEERDIRGARRHGAVLVDRHRHDLAAGRERDRAVEIQARVLHRQRATRQRRQQQREALVEARADDDPVRVGDHAARAAEVGGERRPQLRAPAQVAVAEHAVGRGREALPQRTQPRLTRERADVRRPRLEVQARHDARFDRPGGRLGGAAEGHTGRRAGTRRQVALDGQLRVGLRDRPAREPEVGRERARGREAVAGEQPPVADRRPHRPLQRRPALAARRQLDVQVARTGPVNRSELALSIGPVCSVPS